MPLISPQKLFDCTRKTILTVYLRAKCRHLVAVALRIALRGSLSHYLSLRILRPEGLSTDCRGSAQRRSPVLSYEPIPSAAAVAAAAAVAVAAAAAAQQDDDQNDPQAAPAAKATTATIVAPHHRSTSRLMIETWSWRRSFPLSGPVSIHTMPPSPCGAYRAKNSGPPGDTGTARCKKRRLLTPAQRRRCTADSRRRAGRSGPHGRPAPRCVRGPAP